VWAAVSDLVNDFELLTASKTSGVKYFEQLGATLIGDIEEGIRLAGQVCLALGAFIVIGRRFANDEELSAAIDAVGEDLD
jgi:hypothetical protein